MSGDFRKAIIQKSRWFLAAASVLAAGAIWATVTDWTRQKAVDFISRLLGLDEATFMAWLISNLLPTTILAASIAAAYWLGHKRASSTASEKEDKLNDELKRLRSDIISTIPKLFGTIDSVHTAVKDCLNIIICVSIKNEGGPSIADHWEAFFVSSAGSFLGKKLRIQDLKLNHNDHSITLNENHAIYEKAISPIPTGGLVRGWLWVKFEGVKELPIDGDKIVIKFKDVRGKEYTCDLTLKHLPEQTRDPDYFPASGAIISRHGES